MSVQEITQLFAAARMAELAQGLGLDLPDTLTRDVARLAALVQRARSAFHDNATKLHPLLFPRCQGIQHLFQLFAQQREGSRL